MSNKKHPENNTNRAKLASMSTKQLGEYLLFDLNSNVREYTGKNGVGVEDITNYLNATDNISPKVETFTVQINSETALKIPHDNKGLIKITEDINPGDRLILNVNKPTDRAEFIEFNKYYVTDVYEFDNIKIATFVPWGRG